VNGSQLYATNQAIEDLSTTVGASKIKYYSVNSTGGGNENNDGATGADAIAAGKDASATGSNSVAVGNGSTASGVGATATGSGSTATGSGSTAVGQGASANGDGGVALGQGATASNANDVALGSGSTTGAAVGVSSATVNGITYGGFAGANPTSVVSVGSVGNERQVQNVAAGQVTATSTDAVNGSQLYSVASQVSSIGTTVTNVTNQVTQNTTDIKNLQNGSDGMFQVSPDANTTKPTPTGTNSAAGGNNAVASGNNATAVGNDSTASGTGSTAVGNGSAATGDNSVAIGANSVADRDNSVSVGSDGSDRQITHVAAGTAQDDAVNVSQLKSSQAGNVQYDTNVDGSINNTSVTLNPGGASTTIHNVAPGTADTDAANVSQVNDAIKTAENWSQNYTDEKFNTINKDLNDIGNRANAGVASAMAMAGLPQAYSPGKSMAAAAVSSFHGESGVAVGVSTISDSGRWVYKLTGSANTRGDTGVTVGAGVQW
jgi:autotransporter adhesin